MRGSEIFVGAIIINPKGEYLLQKRDSKTRLFPNNWTLFGGRVEKNETTQEAIIRELKEEISIKKKQISSVRIFKVYLQKNGTKQVIFAIISKAKISELKLNEGEKMEFVSPTALFKRKFAFNIKDVLKDFVRLGTQT